MIDVWRASFLRALFFMFFNPICWNAFGSLEYQWRLLTHLAGNNKKLACYLFAAFIFTLGLYRDYL